jgi:hypothetical protein
LEAWLIDYGFIEHVEAFERADLDWGLLTELNDQDLRELGMLSMGERKRFLRLSQAPHFLTSAQRAKQVQSHLLNLLRARHATQLENELQGLLDGIDR